MFKCSVVAGNENPKHKKTMTKIEDAVEEISVLLNREGFLLKEPFDQSWTELFYSFKRSNYDKIKEPEYNFLNEIFFNQGFESVQSEELSEALLDVYSKYGENTCPQGSTGWFISLSRQKAVYSGLEHSDEKHRATILSMAKEAVGRVTQERLSEHLAYLIRS
jgi:hypothetical protein